MNEARRFGSLNLLIDFPPFFRPFFPNRQVSSFPFHSLALRTMEASTTLAAVASVARRMHEGHDAAHDFAHVERVRRLAASLAGEDENLLPRADAWLAEVAALLHDIKDYKQGYADGDTEIEARSILKEVGVEAQATEDILYAISECGFKKSLPHSDGRPPAHARPPSERASALRDILNDADLLDAIGAIGVARCFAFGGKRDRLLYNPDGPDNDGDGEALTQEAYAQRSQGQSYSLDHFGEKLFKLKALMRTKAGAARATQRHDFMVAFVQQFKAEREGRA